MTQKEIALIHLLKEYEELFDEDIEITLKAFRLKKPLTGLEVYGKKPIDVYEFITKLKDYFFVADFRGKGDDASVYDGTIFVSCFKSLVDIAVNYDGLSDIYADLAGILFGYSPKEVAIYCSKDELKKLNLIKIGFITKRKENLLNKRIGKLISGILTYSEEILYNCSSFGMETSEYIQPLTDIFSKMEDLYNKILHARLVHENLKIEDEVLSKIESAVGKKLAKTLLRAGCNMAEMPSHYIINTASIIKNTDYELTSLKAFVDENRPAVRFSMGVGSEDIPGVIGILEIIKAKDSWN